VAGNGQTDINLKLRYNGTNERSKTFLRRMQIFARNGILVQGDNRRGKSLVEDKEEISKYGAGIVNTRLQCTVTNI
jgi:hypothetical protein